jgi:hypothetical protein
MAILFACVILHGCTQPSPQPPQSNPPNATTTLPNAGVEAPTWNDIAESELDTLAQQLNGQTGLAQITTARRLARIGTPDAAKALAPYAQRSGPLQAIALAGIGFADHPPYRDILLAGLRSRDSPARKAALWSIAATGSTTFSRPLGITARHERAEVRSAGIEAIGLLGYEWMLPEVSHASFSEDAQERLAALKSLKRIGTRGSLLLLTERLATLSDEEEQAVLKGAPLKRPTPGTLPDMSTQTDAELIEVLRDVTKPLIQRATAAFLLGSGGNFEPLLSFRDKGPKLLQLASLSGEIKGGQILPPRSLDTVKRWLQRMHKAHPCLFHAGDASLYDWQ